MKRKTNLFYKSASQDSNFLTFSNYTEVLTGNLMSTDNKIFPSTFLCLQSDKLNDIEFAKETYNKHIQDIKNSKNVKYVLKTDVRDFWVNDTQDMLKIYEQDGVVWRANAILNEDCIENLPSDVTFIINIFMSDEETKVGTEEINPLNIQSWQRSATINKIYLDWNEEPAFMNDDNDIESVYLWNKQQLLNLLTAKYENKLAALRDWCVENGKQQDKTLLPLNYLIETLIEFDENIKITFVGDVTEQDWNGTFADTICVIDTSGFNSYYGVSTLENPTKSKAEFPNESDEYLYGWWVNKTNYTKELDYDRDGKNTVSVTLDDNNKIYTYHLNGLSGKELAKFKKEHQISTVSHDDYNTYFSMIPDTDQNVQEWMSTLDDIVEASRIYEKWKGPKYAEDIKPIYDNDNEDEVNHYIYTSNIDKITFNKYEDKDIIKEVKFNLLVPLFDIVDCNYVTNSTYVEKSSYLPLTIPTSDAMVKNIPLGLWFSGPNSVSLKPDNVTKFSPTWSLSLSSQFKPFPNSTHMPSEITQDAKKEAYLTFAQILARQNDIFDKVSTIHNDVASLSNRVSTLESCIGAVLNSYNLDTFRSDIADYKNMISYQVSYLESIIEGLELRWVNRES